ncbi:uncharacterized protein N7483_011109 [Penicillium malachiteum]|uniref:uncharacterized protein n=1 Tax=Penicillium malachiteum TaxID=1324776 RepID=UPI002549AF19|nr:uncharacterized protein N7483_011109 [Penicillium malachiteum]KAJ5713928.1 hypothetical protein N7483_011109 [Penicillium malachiteum]
MQYKTLAMLCATAGFAKQSKPLGQPAWLSSMIYDSAFADSVALEEEAGTMPAWCNNLPVSVLGFFSHRDAVIASYLGVDGATTTQSDTFTSYGSIATATTTTVTTAVETGSSNTHPISVSTSTGGSPAATGALYMSLAGAAGILGFSLAL